MLGVWLAWSTWGLTKLLSEPRVDAALLVAGSILMVLHNWRRLQKYDGGFNPQDAFLRGTVLAALALISVGFVMSMGDALMNI